LLLAPRDLFANGKPPHVIKVSVRWPVRDQKSPLSLGWRMVRPPSR
jgi:hypothetical protein